MARMSPGLPFLPPPPAATVAVRDVVEALDSQDAQTRLYLDRRRGTILRISDHDPDVYDDDLLESLESDRYLPLPDQHDVHEWEIMRDFCLAAGRGALRDELWQAIHGRGAFRAFKNALHRHGVQDDWYAFLEAELETIAVDWLEENGIPYTRA